MKFSKNKLEEYDLSLVMMDRVKRLFSGIEPNGEVDLRYHVDGRYSYFIIMAIAEKVLGQDRLIKLAADCAMLNISVIRDLVSRDEYMLITSVLSDIKNNNQWKDVDNIMHRVKDGSNNLYIKRICYSVICAIRCSGLEYIDSFYDEDNIYHEQDLSFLGDVYAAVTNCYELNFGLPFYSPESFLDSPKREYLQDISTDKLILNMIAEM